MDKRKNVNLLLNKFLRYSILTGPQQKNSAILTELICA